MTKCLDRRQVRMTRAVVVEPPRTESTTRTIAVCSTRGGIGKTTVAARLARALGVRGERSVLVDLDPRGCATAALAPPTPPAPLVQAVGLEALGSMAGADVEHRVCNLVGRLAGEATVVVLDCPPESPGRVGRFTGAALAAARAGGPGSGVLAVMSPAAPDPAGTAELLARGGPEAVLGLVVNGVRNSGIEASHHDVARCLGAPVLARVPAVEHPVEPPAVAGVVDEAIGVLAGMLTSRAGLTAAWAGLQSAPAVAARRDVELARLLEAELARLRLDPEAELDPEFELGLELLRNRVVLAGRSTSSVAASRVSGRLASAESRC